VTGNLELVSMIVDHPDLQTLIGIYRDKLGTDPDMDMATKKAWNLKGGKLLIDRRAFVIHTDKFERYDEEQQKQKQNKSASSL
jgi:hypothetical protein